MTPERRLTILRREARPLEEETPDLEPIVEAIGDAHWVLLGEASHGTHEFYRLRAELTRRLVAERGFDAVAVEADWPAASRVHRFVRGARDIGDAEDALSEFERFPTWMWRNEDVLDFVGWLRQHNDGRPETERVGFYGVDLYSLHESIHTVLAYLSRIDPAAEARARERYSCFDHFRGDAQVYGYAATAGIAESCEDAVVAQLLEMRRRAEEYARRDGHVAREAFFQAEQNARLVRDAEEYYRAMYRGRASSWNLRDRHMAETLESLAEFLRKEGRPAKIVVWAHNSHLGDARATEMGSAGELNVGQLVRERHGRDGFSVGFTTHDGTVTAATDWGGPAERKRVRPSLRDSHEALFHEVGIPRFFLTLAAGSEAARALEEPRLERAIGVIYRPETERQSHYFLARLPEQFDAVIHCDTTHAVEPLERLAPVPAGEAPETYPTAL
jgi:erythromycin esterase-like protein